MNKDLLNKLKTELDAEDFVNLCRAFAISELLDIDFFSNLKSASATLAMAADVVDDFDVDSCCCNSCDCKCEDTCNECSCECNICDYPCLCNQSGNLDLDEIPSNVTFLFDENGPTTVEEISKPDPDITIHRISSSGLD